MQSENPSIHPDQLFAQAVSLQRTGRTTEAAALYRQLLVLSPDNPRLLNNLGTAELSLGRLKEALTCFDRAVAVKPDYAEAHINRGTALQGLGRLTESLASCDRAIALRPDSAEAHNNRGSVLGELHRPAEALESCDRALALRPDYVDAHLNRGSALENLGRFTDALASFDRAIALRPDSAEAHCLRGGVLRELHLTQEALASFDRSLVLRPGYAKAHNGRGLVMEDLGRMGDALACFDRAVTFEPDYAWPHWNKALAKLALGDFDEGWKLYEWRWKGPRKDLVRNFPQPLWLGDRSIAGKTLLVHAEQGLGDTIQFCRYVPMIGALGARVILEVQPVLASLLSTVKTGPGPVQYPDFTLIERGRPLPTFDCHCPIMSLPLAFKTTLATVPATVPYLFADDGKREAWRSRLGPRSGPRIGLSWSGRKDHRNDHNRSIPLATLAPLFELPFEFHAVQKDIRPEDAAAAARFASLRLHESGLADFSDTAALIEEMDLVISVDTAVGHLAGALGKPVWILLPFVPDFRWMLGRFDSPWYPTATLIRQPALGDWTAVIAAVTERLKA